MTGSYNNFFRIFDRTLKKDYTLEASRDVAKPKMVLKPRKVGNFLFFFTKNEQKNLLYFFMNPRLERLRNGRRMKLVWTA
jgi:hypothetical protein